MSFPRVVFITLAIMFLLQNVLYADQEVEHHGEKIVLGPRICLECHEDMETHSHPTLIQYPPEGKEADFATADSLLGQGLVLIDNQLVCITCHDVKNNQPGHLVMDNSQSRLCRTCHLK